MALPTPHHADLIATNLISDGTYRYACWYARDLSAVFFGQQPLAGGAWTTHQFAGANASALAVPVADDEHNFPAIVLLGNGKAMLLANMHNDPLRGVISTNAVAGDITNWTPLTTAAFSGIGTRVTYPIPTYRPDGSVRLYLREGLAGSGSGQADSAYWDCPAGSGTFGAKTSIFKGLVVANAKGPGVAGDGSTGDTDYNWNAYPTLPVVQDVGDGNYVEHWAWCWRRIGTEGDRTNDRPSYMQYRSATNSWHTITGEPVTLPVDPINSTSVQMGLTSDGEGYLNFGGMAVDPAGIPHLIISQNPWYYITWNGTAWTQTTLGTGGGWSYRGKSVVGRINCIWWRGSLWFMANQYIDVNRRRPMLWRYGGVSGETIALGSLVPTSGWEFGIDRIRFRDSGLIETLTHKRDGITPFVATIGAMRTAA